MGSKEILREKIWTKLRKVAIPDSRFRYDFSMFIPDFQGSSECTKKIREMDLWKNARTPIVIEPDNCLDELRKYAVLDNKTQIMSTYGIWGGYLIWGRDDVPEGQEEFAGTLDGSERFGKPISLQGIKKYGRLDLVVTGAAAVNLDGIRYGKGHGYFDLEWGIFSAIGAFDDTTTVVTVVHDCQIIEKKLPASEYDTITDYIVTPTRLIKVKSGRQKPKGVFWNKLQKDMIAKIPTLHELKEIEKRKT